VEAQADLPRRVDLHLEQVSRRAGEDVVVIGGGRAARARECGQPGTGRGALDLRVHVRPHRVERLQPLEQRRLLCEPARGPLVEVVVAVHEAGRGQAAAAVDADLVLALGVRRRPGADRVDPAVADDDVAVGVLGPVRVDRGDRAALDHEPAHAAARDAARRTASRIFS
jgi:hypothetical protein